MSTENSKDKVILVRCAILGPATALFRLIGADATFTAFAEYSVFQESLYSNVGDISQGACKHDDSMEPAHED